MQELTLRQLGEQFAALDGQTVKVYGWVRTIRDSKNFAFIELNDGTKFKSTQIVADADMDGYKNVVSQNVGAGLCVVGTVVVTPNAQQPYEIKAQSISVEATSSPQYPLQKKRHTIEFLREIAYLRPRTNLIGAVMRVRSTLAYAVHSFFQENGFVYVNTPLITTSDCEGAGETFQVTTLDLDNVPRTKEGKVDYSADFFGKKASLTVSGQLEGESYALALKNIYTFGPTFRAENSNTTRHLAEFWMVEPEMAFCDLELDEEIAESFLKYIFSYVLEHCREDMEFFDSFVLKGNIDTLRHVIETPFARMTYTDAIRELEKVNSQFEYPVHWGSDIQTEHEKYLTEVVCRRPVIVTDYPKEIKAFYMKQNEDGKTVRGMDVLVPRLGEIIGGSEREADYDKLLARINELGLNPDDYWWYLETRRFGSVPHAGFGLGFERAVQYVTGVANIRDVIPYPRYSRSAEF